MSRPNQYVMQFSKTPGVSSTPRIRHTIAYPLKIGRQYRLSFWFKKHQLYGSGGKFTVKVKTGTAWAAAGDTVLVNANVTGTLDEWTHRYCSATGTYPDDPTQSFTATASPVYVMFGGEWGVGSGVVVSIDNVVLERAPQEWDGEAAVVTSHAGESKPTTDWYGDSPPETEWS